MSVVPPVIKIAQASRILASLAIVDAFGHVSCRSDGAATFLMSRSLAPELVQPSDVVELDLSGECQSYPQARLFLERFIHSEIYRARPDVAAIVHSHCQSVLPFTVVPTIRVRPIFHIGGFLAGTPGPFDIADHAGRSSDLLVRTAALGERLAEHLGNHSVVLMRGHGFTAVGQSIEEAVFRAVYTARNCEVQSAAMGLGDPVFLSDEEAKACDSTTRSQLDRAWTLWLRRIPSFDEKLTDENL